MAEVTARVIVAVTADDGRQYAWDATKTGHAPDDTCWVAIVAQALLGVHAEQVGEQVATSGLSEAF